MSAAEREIPAKTTAKMSFSIPSFISGDDTTTCNSARALHDILVVLFRRYCEIFRAEDAGRARQVFIAVACSLFPTKTALFLLALPAFAANAARFTETQGQAFLKASVPGATPVSPLPAASTLQSWHSLAVFERTPRRGRKRLCGSTTARCRPKRLPIDVREAFFAGVSESSEPRLALRAGARARSSPQAQPIAVHGYGSRSAECSSISARFCRPTAPAAKDSTMPPRRCSCRRSHAEKYLEAAKLALNYASKDPRARAKFLVAVPGPGVSPEAAARTILAEFLPRAFRRPVDKVRSRFLLGLFSSGDEARRIVRDAIAYALRAS